MAATVTGLLELARAQSNAAGREQALLGAVVAGVLRDLDQKSRVRTALSPELTVATAPELAARAIAPVLDNAIRLAENVIVSARQRGDWVDVRISDDGPGVPDHDAVAIFEPGHTGGDGSGLGLALARRVARSVGGDVTLEESDGAGPGAVFLVRLPATAKA